jgi:O-Antigen ligase
VDQSRLPTDTVITADAWPRTRRPLPWLIAGFLAAVYLIPIDGVHLKIPLPFSSDFDRFCVAAIVATWVTVAVAGNRREAVIRLRPRGWAAGMTAFISVVVISITINIGRITNLGEWDTTQKKLAVLVAMIAMFAIFTLTLRVAELRAFTALIAILATITAIGTTYEEKTDENIFYTTAASVLSPIATVDPPPTEENVPGAPGRPVVSGPTRQALSVTSILGMSIPFAVVLAAVAPTTRRRILWGLAACVIFTGALITQRRSGLVVPAFALLAMFMLRPRQFLRLVPFGIVALAIGLVLSGGGFSAVNQVFGNSGDKYSTEGRTADYEAIVPDLLTTPALGRGFGTLDSIRHDTYRIFDNEYLDEVYQVGLLGLLAFLALILTPLLIVRYVLRSDNPYRGPPALAAGAGCLAFGIAAGLYDILNFPQAPYLFLFMAAVCTCAASVEVPSTARTRAALRAGSTALHPHPADRGLIDRDPAGQTA